MIIHEVHFTDEQQIVKPEEVDLISGRSTDKGHKEIRVLEREEDRLKPFRQRALEWIF